MCKECGFVASNERSLGRHLANLHKETEIIDCKLCSSTFNSKYEYNVHIKAHKVTNFTCKYCEKDLAHERSLKHHISAWHKSKGPINCDYCESEFTTQYEFQRHVQNHRNAKKLLKTCSICSKKFANVKQHIKRFHNKVKDYKCTHCDKEYSSPQMLKYHNETTHVLRVITCDQCDFKTNHQRNLKTHKDTMHSEVQLIECEMCGKSIKNLTQHMKKIHRRQTSKCEVCDKVVVNLKTHMIRIHFEPVDGAQWHNCDICEKRIFGKMPLMHHRKIHFKTRKKIPCEYETCDFSADSKYKLQNHISGIHLKLRPFECDVCDAAFKRKGHLKGHYDALHSDSGRNRFACEKCNFKTDHQTNFKNHVNAVHLGIRAYQCDTCKISFTQRSHLNTHRKSVHLNVRQYLCKFCDTKFFDHKDLEVHQKAVHGDFEGEPEFHCEVCDFKTHYDQSLKRHISSFHSEGEKSKTFKCDECGKSFVQLRSLKSHIRSFHN